MNSYPMIDSAHCDYSVTKLDYQFCSYSIVLGKACGVHDFRSVQVLSLALPAPSRHYLDKRKVDCLMRTGYHAVKAMAFYSLR